MEKKWKAPMFTLTVKWWIQIPWQLQKKAVATNSLASSDGVDRLAVSREATKPPDDSKDQHDDVQVKKNKKIK